MKIKRAGFASFKISFNEIDIVTDPMMSNSASGKFSSVEGDVVLISESQYIGKYDVVSQDVADKITPLNRPHFIEITNAGEYEIGGVVVRRPMGSDFYILDEADIRVVYFGGGTKDVKVDQLKDLGDVDILIIPVGLTEPFADFDSISKIVSTIDPTRLILSGYKVGGEKLLGEYSAVGTAQDFIKEAGYTHITEEKTLKVTKGAEAESKVLDVVILS